MATSKLYKPGVLICVLVGLAITVAGIIFCKTVSKKAKFSKYLEFNTERIDSCTVREFLPKSERIYVVPKPKEFIRRFLDIVKEHCRRISPNVIANAEYRYEIEATAKDCVLRFQFTQEIDGAGLIQYRIGGDDKNRGLVTLDVSGWEKIKEMLTQTEDNR